MNKKNLLTLIIVLGVVLVVAVSAIILPQIIKNYPAEDPSETESPEDFFASYFETFSCLSVTIGGDPKTSVNLCWQMLGELDECLVFYCENHDNETSISEEDFDNRSTSISSVYEEELFSIPDENQYEIKEPVLIEKSGYVHRAYITGLKEGTSYFYRIISKSGEKTDICSFKTAGTSNEFSFLIVTDTQGYTVRNYDVWGEVIKLATESFPDYSFIVHLGDAVEDGKNLYQWQMFFNSCQGILRNSTTIDVLGNQDKKNTLLHYTNGAEGNRTALVGGYYSFDWGGIHFSVLNTGDGNNDLAKSQIKWLKEDLKATDATDKILLIHKAPYSNGNHYQEEEIIAIREQLLPILQKYNVKICLEGHDHLFFRSLPLNSEGAVDYEVAKETVDGDETKMFTINGSGTIFFMNGSAGTKQHKGELSSDGNILMDKSEIMEGPSFTYVSVSESSIVFKTYVVLNSQIHLYDSFGITR